MQIAVNVLQQSPITEAPEWWKLADDAGVDVIGLPDSPALVRDLYVTAALCAQHTKRARVMTAVTNPLSRDPAVTASALRTLEEIAPGRIAMGIGTGDSAMWGVGRKPATVARLREYIVAVKRLVRGEEADYGGRRFRLRWADAPPPAEIPVLVAVSGPKVLRMACEVADGMLLAMGFGPDNVAYVRSLIEQGCQAAGRQPAELECWWNSEIVFGDSAADARSRGMGVGTEWLTMGTTEGKQIPEHLKPALVQFNADVHDLAAEYQDEDREGKLIDRARELGLYDWLMARAPGLWGRPAEVADRLRELEADGMDRWMFYVGRRETDRMNHLHLICNEVLPRLRSPLGTTPSNGVPSSDRPPG